MNATHLIAASLFATIASIALGSEAGFSNDSKCNAPTGIGDRRACEKAKEGFEALRRSVERTRMIYGLSYWDFYDTVITSQVQAGIFDEPTLKVNEIIVDTFQGVVQLSGPVKLAGRGGQGDRGGTGHRRRELRQGRHAGQVRDG